MAEAVNFRPWANNALGTRGDVEAALKALALPLEKYRSAGGARIRLGSSGAHFDAASAEMEGFARLLWGLAPAQYGGADWIDWAPIRAGLVAGCNPAHPEYWGDPHDFSQRLVELAAIGLALRLVPECLWTPLSEQDRVLVSDYLRKGHGQTFADNNWKFFRLLISLGLRHVGETVAAGPDFDYRAQIEAFSLGHGWYQDGFARRADHYVPFAFHYYGLILAALDGGAWTKVYRSRAAQLAPQFAAWFAADGAPLSFGRSMTYRFAGAGFWGALALAEDETYSPGALKGLYLRNLRWWARQEIAGRDGVLTIGYGYDNLLFSEPYNSPQSPYWCFKAFLPLMLPETHPFWAAQEESLAQQVSVQPEPGFILGHPRGDAVALSAGQSIEPDNTFIRFGAEKYSKFSYSARYGFSIESDLRRFKNGVFENMIGFSADGVTFAVREKSEIARIGGDVLFSRWSPLPDVTVETWLYWQGEFQLRHHRIHAAQALSTIEGGTAIARPGMETGLDFPGIGLAVAGKDVALILDLSGFRQGRCHVAPPNTNLVACRTLVPQLLAQIPAGCTILTTACYAGPAAAGEPRPPEPRALDELEQLIAREGRAVGVTRAARL